MKKLSALIVTATTYFTLAGNASAASLIIDPCPKDNASNNFALLCKLSPTGDIFSAVILTAFIAASLIALAFLVFGGIKWITSGGDKAGVESARNMIVAALVGLVITFLAYFIISIVFGLFGLNFGNFQLPQITLGN